LGRHFDPRWLARQMTRAEKVGTVLGALGVLAAAVVAMFAY
jgi:hypothetical protein